MLLTTRSKTRKTARRQLVFGLLGTSVLLILGGLAGTTSAQARVVISDVRVTTLSPTYADISWNTDVAADSAIRWGEQGTGLPNDEPYSSTETTTHTLRIEPLTPSTLYEYRVGSKRDSDPEDDRTWSPAMDQPPRFLETPAGGGGNEPPVLTSMQVNANCCTARFIFETNRDAGYTLLVQEIPATSTSPDGAYEDAWNVLYPDEFIPNNIPLQASTDYSYRISVRDQDNNSREYGPFTFRTGLNQNDYVFTPGACIDGTLLGQCNEDGWYCGPGGLVLNCVVCGFECQINQTCRTGGACTDDPGSGETAYQCNPPSCYQSICQGGDNEGSSCNRPEDCPDGACTGEGFIEPAGPGCYSTWNKCNANTVLKVGKDRVCNRWMTCRTQTDVQNPTTRQTESLCYDLAACASIGPDGQCAKPLYGKYCVDDPLRFCETSADCDIPLCKPASGKWCSQAWLDPDTGLREFRPCEESTDCDDQGLPDATCDNFGPANVTYQSPDDVQKIRYLSGAINAGLDWSQGQQLRIEGNFPWYFMPQQGSVVPVGNGHFEERETLTTFGPEGTKKTTTEYTTKPWSAFGDRGSDNSEPSVLVTAEEPGNPNNPNHVLKIDPTDAPVPFSGAQAPNQPFSTSEKAQYFITFRAKSSSPDGQQIQARFYAPDGTAARLKDANLTSGWQTFVSESPVTGLAGGSAWLQFVRTNGPADPFFVDDVEINVMLGIKARGGTNLEYVPRSCRLYPREDSLLCEYRDESGVRYKGWYGYCLERDPKIADRCVSWWPVDIIGGEADVFGTFGSEVTAGYSNRSPLYYCLEARGVTGGDRLDLSRYRCHNFIGGHWTDCDWEEFDITTEGNIRFGRTTLEGYVQDAWECGTIYGYDTDADGRTESLLYGCNEKAVWGSCQNDGPFPNGQETFNNYTVFTLNGEDQYRKKELSRIVIREIEATHNDWTFGPIVLDESNSWKSSASFANGNNEFAIEAVFDENDVLKQYRIYGCDITDGGGGMVSQVEYHMRESCTKVAKVVDDDGKNRAWTGRVTAGSGYQTRATNYRFTDDLAPFGGAVPAGSDPTDWADLLYVEAPRTNEAFTYPYQTRAGLPAACEGDCSSRVCIGGGIKDGELCRTADDCRSPQGEQGVCSGVGTCSRSLKACSANRDAAGTCKNRDGTDAPDENCCSADNPDDICIGGAGSEAGFQYYAFRDRWQCKISGAWCRCRIDPPGCADPNNDFDTTLCEQYVDGDTCEWKDISQVNSSAFGIENLRRLFAESYGFWTWNPKLGRYKPQPTNTDPDQGTESWPAPSNLCQTCSNNSSLACSVNADCGGGNTCEAKKTRGQRNLANPDADYCGNRTNAFGFKVNDEEDNVADITDGGWVNFKFNTSADPEQLPLSSILLKWTEGEEQSIYFPYAPKGDENSPHVMSHRYFCNAAMLDDLPNCSADPKTRSYPCATQRTCSDDGSSCNVDADCNVGATCQPGNACVYQPRVIVEDNWGWCNGVPVGFQNSPNCNVNADCPVDSPICDPRFKLCIQNTVCIKFSENYPPSWAYESGTFDSTNPIEVRVQPAG